MCTAMQAHLTVWRTWLGWCSPLPAQEGCCPHAHAVEWLSFPVRRVVPAPTAWQCVVGDFIVLQSSLLEDLMGTAVHLRGHVFGGEQAVAGLKASPPEHCTVLNLQIVDGHVIHLTASHKPRHLSQVLFPPPDVTAGQAGDEINADIRDPCLAKQIQRLVDICAAVKSAERLQHVILKALQPKAHAIYSAGEVLLKLLAVKGA
eukprot:scaffold1499_cov255-Pinguiococcus_pyrenoidosus.AAC.4